MITTIIIIIEEITNQIHIVFVSIPESICWDGKIRIIKSASIMTNIK
ncbi:MAG: hypothetical protein PHH85_08770 [Candidatus Methanoperedens sp.]|nr:hypothetical protein [Candidatus Methanoperedens sp.]